MGRLFQIIGTYLLRVFGINQALYMKNLAFILVVAGIQLSITVAFIASLNVLFEKVGTTMPSNHFVVSAMSLLPSNTTVCLSIAFSAHVASFIYMYKKRLVQLFTRLKG